MMAEYGSAFHDAQGGIYSWLAGSIGEKWAFIGMEKTLHKAGAFLDCMELN